MLKHLTIRNYALIKQLELEPSGSRGVSRCLMPDRRRRHRFSRTSSIGSGLCRLGGPVVALRTTRDD